MNAVCFNVGADLILAGQVRHGKRVQGPCSMGALSWLGKKPLFPEFRLIDTPESIHNYKGFFTSAVTTTKDSLLNSAGCGGKIGNRLPLGTCLAALVERLHNLFGLSGKMSKLRNELTRHAHLVLVASKARMERKAMFVSIAPLSNLLSKIN